MLDLHSLSPYVRVAMDSKIDYTWRITERVIFDYELLYIKEGKALIMIEDQAYTGSAGDVFLLKPRQRHSIEPIGNIPFWQPHIHFDLFYREDSPEVKVSFKPLNKMTSYELKLFREDVTQHSNLTLPNKLHISNIKHFEDMLFEIIKEYGSKMPFYEITVKGLFLNLLQFILYENTVSDNQAISSNRRVLEAVRKYLDCNFDREVRLDELSRETNMCKHHLARLFKQAFGIAPIHYHQMIRIEKAKEMVQYSDMSLTEISERMGFHSIHAFSRAFRNVEGMPPSFYRGNS